MPVTILRLKRIQVINTRDFWGKAEVKLLSTVTSEDIPYPAVTTVADAKRVAQEVLSRVVMLEVAHIKKNHEMIFGDTGYSLWMAASEIDSFNWQMRLVDSDAGIREFGSFLTALTNDPAFDTFLGDVLQLAAFAMNPSVTLAINIGKYVLGKVGEVLSKNKDDELGVVYQSFYRPLDFLCGRDAVAVPDISGNLRLDYQIYTGD